MGVTKEHGKFRARITHMGTRYHVGTFDTELKAKRAITRTKKKLVEQDDFFIKSDLSKHKLGFEDVVDTRTGRQKARDIRDSGKSFIDRLIGKIGKWKK